MPEFDLTMINWMNCIWKGDLPSNSKLIAAYLRSHMNDQHDIAWPSLTTIQGKTGLSRATVVKYIDVLCDSGWLIRDHDSRNSTTYIATFPKVIEEQVKNINSLGAKLADSLGGELGSLGAKPEVVYELNPNKQSNKQVNKINDAFSVFWKNWRIQKQRLGNTNYGSKSDALVKFKKLFGRRNEEELKLIVNHSLVKLETVVDDLLINGDRSDYFNYRNMYPQKFLGSEDWLDEQ